MTHTNTIESHFFKNTVPDKTLLAVFAHPDDETFGPGSTLARYAAEGVAVHYACATRGEAGEIDETLLTNHKDAAELRTTELFCAAQALNLTGLHFLNYRDSGMEGSADNEHPDSLVQAPLAEVAGKIVYLIRKLQPQVILTFDPTGGYFHPDHIAIHKATTEAFHAAGDSRCYPQQLDEGLRPFQPQKLYYTAFPQRLLKLLIGVMPLLGRDPTAFGRNGDINLKRIASVQQRITTRINVRPYFEARFKASACHHSQGGGRHRGPQWLQRWLLANEDFVRAVPPVPTDGVSCVERDFFDSKGRPS